MHRSPRSLVRDRLKPLGPGVVIFLISALGAACSTVSEPAGPSAEAPPSDDPIVARYATSTITLVELDSAFVRAAGGRAAAADSSLSSYREFLDRYLNYRLKVRAAQDAGLDTVPSVRREIHDYRQQRARPQVLRERVYEPVARTLYQRRQEAVDVSHILIDTDSSEGPLAARRTAQAVADSIEQGVPFGDLAIRHSDDPSARKEGTRGYRGRLGYLRAGQIAEPFEQRMHALHPGETSDVFRTQYGYHILKVHDRRPAEPPVELAHILRRPRGNTVTARRLLDSLRTAISSGRLSFAAAARKYSHDQQSAPNGGSLGEVDPQSLPASLRRTVATMDSVGEISEVVQTRFGYHLLKLTGRQEQRSFEEAYDGLKEQITGQPRAERKKAAFAETLRTEVGTAVDTARLLAVTRATSVDSLARPLLAYADTLSEAAPAVATLGDSSYTVDQMANRLLQTDGGAQMTIADLIDSFLNEKAIQYAATRRALNDTQLATEVQKFRDGTLLFRYMQDSVWTPVAQDSARLRAWYRKNRDDYRFPERVRTVSLRAPADSVLEPYAAVYERDSSIAAVVETAATDSLVSTDTVYVTPRSPVIYQPVRAASNGTVLGPTAQENEWQLLIRDRKLPARIMRFEEARTRVLQDYEDRLEQRLVHRLRERYNAETFPERLQPPVSDESSTP